MFSFKNQFGYFGQHWFGFVIIVHVAAFVFQSVVIRPFEIAVAGHIGSLASLLFLPHAVRVLSVWLLGPKAFFALFPASLFVNFLYGPVDYGSFTFVLIPLWSSASAVLAFEFLRITNRNVYPSTAANIDWRSLVFAGCLASFFNSLGGTYLKSDGLTVSEILELLVRYFVGDAVGLLLCLFVLTLLLRYHGIWKR